jgi:hypothetical protein
MNHTDSPHLEAVDQLLSRFMKSEMPHPWPKAPQPQREVVVPHTPASAMPVASLASSRWSLACSVALIVGGFWLLSSLVGTETNPNRSGGLNGGSATTKHLNDLAKPAPEKTNKTMP